MNGINKKIMPKNDFIYIQNSYKLHSIFFFPPKENTISPATSLKKSKVMSAKMQRGKNGKIIKASSDLIIKGLFVSFFS